MDIKDSENLKTMRTVSTN
ncbi:rCG22492 [Rattus norvegicus]|uniref:RCG22492 n=1 Tax=Rattus norvegicus TaxID=10116 RepID=A6IPB5_RAT|nr:rCG22492 [Rattus norvegicus]